MKERQSNIELLRIISMFLIVLEHLLIMGTDFFSSPIGNQLLVANSIIGFTYVGVNCFILITGYFGADFSWKRLLSLYLVCAFYEVVEFVVAYYYGDAILDRTALSYMLFPLSHSSNWFVRCYVCLLFLLPLINVALNNLDKKGFTYVLVLLVILNLYFGWFHKQEDFNATGYTTAQMVFVYVIGRYISRFIDIENIRSQRIYILAIWFASSLLWGGLQNINDTIHIVPHWNGWAYNNPVQLISAIALFLFFCTFESKPSRIVNALAVGMFPVFLIHMNRYLGSYLFHSVHDVIYSNFFSHALLAQVVMLIVIAILIIIVCSIIDIPRARLHKLILCHHYENLYTHTHTRGAEPRNNKNSIPQKKSNES